jgi:hypothetical protein
MSGSEALQSLTECAGEYFETFELPPVGNYIVVDEDGFNGSIKLLDSQKFLIKNNPSKPFYGIL